MLYMARDSWWLLVTILLALILSWNYVSLLVQVAGITLCSNAAAKISHRAQGIASLARWHATVTCSSTVAFQLRVSRMVTTSYAALLERLFYSTRVLFRPKRQDDTRGCR